MRLLGIWLSKPDVPELKRKRNVRGLAAALGYTDVEVRRSAAQALGEVGDVSAFLALTKALEDESAKVREEAVRALQKVAGQDQRTPAALVMALRRAVEQASTGESSFAPEDAGFIVAASEALSALGSDGTVDTIHMALPRLRGKNVVRVSLVLGDLGDLRAVASLSEALEDEELAKEQRLLERSVAFLIKSGDATAFDTVHKILPLLRANEAARISLTLGKLGDRRAVTSLGKALEDKTLAEDHDLLERSAEFLGKSGDAPAFDTVRTILAYTKASKYESLASGAMLACISALAALKPDAAVEMLCEEYRESEHLKPLYRGKVRSQIVKEIEPIADERTVDILCEALSGGEADSATVVRMLKKIGDPRGMAVVQKHEEQIAQREEERRNRALFCKRIRDLQSKDLQISQEAKRNLQNMGPKAIPLILRAFDSGDESDNPRVGPYAREAFGKELCHAIAVVFPFPELVEKLTRLLNDFHTPFQGEIVVALSKIGPEAAPAKSAIDKWLSYLLSAQSHRTDAIRDAREALLAIDQPAAPQMPEARLKEIKQNRAQGIFPCILCGRDIRAAFGSNTIYAKGRTFACCNAGCGRPQGAYDTSYVQGRIEGLSEEERCRSELPPDLT